MAIISSDPVSRILGTDPNNYSEIPSIIQPVFKYLSSSDSISQFPPQMEYCTANPTMTTLQSIDSLTNHTY